MERDIAAWSVADAKARLSELIDRALSDGPQVITRGTASARRAAMPGGASAPSPA